MQGDTWWQLRAGQDMWSARAVLLSDIYSHTASGAFWLNHEWLAEVIFFGLYSVGGLPLLSLFAAALISAGWTFTWCLTRGSSVDAFVVALIALTASAGWWEPRPHAFSLLFIPWLVFLVYRSATGWLPILFLVWANTHGGVLLGLVLLASGLAAQILVDRSLWRRSLIVVITSALAMTLTPLGVHLWTEVPRSLSRINLYTLDEWAPPGLTDPTMIAFWGIAATYAWNAAAQWRRLPRLSPAEAALHACAIVLLPGAVAAVRNVGPFLMVVIPALTHLWVPEGAPQRRAPRENTTVSSGVTFAVILFAIGGVILTLTTAYRHEWDKLRWRPISAAAIEALRDCPGNLYNRYDEGGMLLWFVPGRKVFLDGRQDPYPPALVLEHIEMETGRRTYGPTFKRHDIRCAFLPMVSPVAAQLSQDGWVSLYHGDQWMVLKSDENY